VIQVLELREDGESGLERSRVSWPNRFYPWWAETKAAE